MKIYKRYEIPPHKGLSCGVGRTQQHFKDECDINYLLKHYNGQTPPPAVYGDCSMFSDLQSAIERVESAYDAFDNLPSEVRQRFNQSPVEFFDFANNPSNYDELVNLGLAVKKRESHNPVNSIVREQNLSNNEESGNSSS